MTLNLILTLIIITSVASATILWITRPRPLTASAQIYQDAIDLIQTHGLNKNSFTPRGLRGVGQAMPHCILGAMAACDPAYDRPGSLYDLPSVISLRHLSYDTLGMYPETVNDRLGYDSVIALLTQARDAA